MISIRTLAIGERLVASMTTHSWGLRANEQGWGRGKEVTRKVMGSLKELLGLLQKAVKRYEGTLL